MADVSSPSADYEFMASRWGRADDLLAGLDALRAGGEKYLPKHKAESPATYADRLAAARYSNVYADILGALASKPFADEVKITDGTASAQLKALAANIDSRGTPLHQLAAEVFRSSIHAGVEFLLVDHSRARRPASGRPLSAAEEREQGLRPYLCRIPAKAMIRLRSDFLGGQEVIWHAAWREDTTLPDATGYGEREVQRIRVMSRERFLGDGGKIEGFGPVTWALFEQQLTTAKLEWVQIDGGSITLQTIPIVPITLGRRHGSSWRVDLPLQACVDSGLDLYRQESNLAWIENLTTFPMLAANGVSPEMEGGKPKPIGVGPSKVLYAPPIGDAGQHGSWAFIEPSSESLRFLASEIEAAEKRMRELGKAPLATTNLTVLQAGLLSAKVNSQIELWGLILRAGLERALALVAQWRNDGSRPQVTMNLDLDAELLGDASVEQLLKMREPRHDGLPDLSRDGLWLELRRRNVLRPSFNAEVEHEQIRDEGPELESDDLVMAALSDLVVPIRQGGGT